MYIEDKSLDIFRCNKKILRKTSLKKELKLEGKKELKRNWWAWGGEGVGGKCEEELKDDSAMGI